MLSSSTISMCTVAPLGARNTYGLRSGLCPLGKTSAARVLPVMWQYALMYHDRRPVLRATTPLPIRDWEHGSVDLWASK